MTIEFSKYLASPDRLNEVSLPELKKMIEHYPSFQTAWILLLKNLKNLNDPEFDNYLKQGAIRISDRRQLYNLLFEEKAHEDMDDVLNKGYLTSATYRFVDESQREDESLTSLVQSIQEKREIKTQEDKIDNAENKFVTETLAKIYAKQGLYKEAILAYEKLSLKYPEKNTYFADQIQELKQITEKNKI
ncbi:hypothetical protein ACUNWD_07310 [Sunxiuqinia sp. A32]|uniref:hypothetical protein n=1 Tax=Sunxiuqinia sp. A32 TaxID=3461496 RepID=UPI004045344B